MCILLSGTANLIRYDFNGNKTIIVQFTKDDIFRRSSLSYKYK